MRLQSLRRRRRLTIFVAMLAALAFTSVARAEPWDGGPDVRSDVEQKLYDVGAGYTESAGRWEYVCLSPAEWTQLIAPEDPSAVWGVVFPYQAPTIAWLSPQSCKAIERVMAGRIGSKSCQVGEEPVFGEETTQESYWTTVRKRVPGWKRVTVVKDGKRRHVMQRTLRWKAVRVQRTRDVVRQVQTGVNPVYATCGDWEHVLFGAQTAPHETMHLGGVGNEAAAECFGMQNLGFWVWKLSGDAAFAREAEADYCAWYQAHRPGTDYGSYDCRPGGALDLDPGEPAWPNRVS